MSIKLETRQGRKEPCVSRWNSSISSNLTDLVNNKTLFDASFRHRCSNVLSTFHFPQ